jgi:hypothetical protein
MIPCYVYKITLKSSGQYYYGSRTANVRHNRLPERDLWISYFTSSNTIKRLIETLGKDSFSSEIVYTNTDSDDVYWYEQQLISEHITNPLCLNKKFQDKLSGDTMFATTGKPSWNKGVPSKLKGVSRSPEVRAKISANRRGKGTGKPPNRKPLKLTDEQKLEISRRMKGKYVGDNNPFFGKTHSDETRQRIAETTSKAQKGRPKPKTPCPHCGLPCAAHTIARHIQQKHITDALRS